MYILNIFLILMRMHQCTELSHNFVHCSTEVCVDQFSHYSKFHSTPAPSCGAIHTFPAYSEFNPVLSCFFGLDTAILHVLIVSVYCF